MFDVISNQSKCVTLKIWSNNGALFQESFSIDDTTFAHVKYLAMKFLLKNILDQEYNYKLISIKSRRTIDEQKTLAEEGVNHGGLIIY